MSGRILVIASGKGGTGKTTLSVNIATALAGMGERTLLIDADLGMPNIGMLLQIDTIATNFYDVLKGTAEIPEATYDGPAGLKVVPCSLSLKSYQNSNIERLRGAITSVKDEYDHIVIDTPPGINRNVLVPFQIADQILLVVNNDVASIVDTLKSSTIARSYGKDIDGVVVNRIRGELESNLRTKIRSTLGVDILSEIPEDPAITKAVSFKTPVVLKYPQSEAAFTMKHTAALLAGIEVPEYNPHSMQEVTSQQSFFGKIRSALFG